MVSTHTEAAEKEENMPEELTSLKLDDYLDNILEGMQQEEEQKRY